ncbi:MAG: S8 family serine peptidase [Bacteroidales bacterium]|nr:S8 family serine peptidase [Bacteroidales bacterium]
MGKKVLHLLVLVFIFYSSHSLFAQNDKYKVIKGERHSFDFRRIDKENYYQNRLRIKIYADYEKHVNNEQIVNHHIFGIESLDLITKQLDLKGIKPVFPSDILKSGYSERHKAWGFHLWYEFELTKDQDIVSLVDKYSSLQEIEIVEPVFKKMLIDYEPDQLTILDEVNDYNNVANKWSPNDPRLNEQWHYSNTGQQGGTIGVDIDLFSAWEIQKGNPDVIVAIIDGGIDHTHQDLQANMWDGIGYNFVSGSATIEPHNHGTHVAGTISAVNNNGIGVSGIAGGSGGGNGVRLMSCQVFASNDLSGGFAPAMIWAADNGAVISQNSWGYTSVGVYSQAVLDAIDYFNQNAGSELGSPLSGGITIFAAGNDGTSGQWYPGCYSGATAVASTNNQDKISWYSNYDTWVDISAPGGETHQVTNRGVLSTVIGNGYAFYQGTSMACPHVSGVAALVVSHIPGEISADELKEILIETTENHYSLNPGYEGLLGTGRLNAFNALSEADSYLTGIRNPKDFAADALSANEVSLSWSRNEDSNPVVLAYSTDPEFGLPVLNIEVGDMIDGGGQVLYIGSDTVFNQTELEAVTPYYYRIWSYNLEGEFSTGRGTHTTTLCSTYNLPFSEDLSIPSMPMCWNTGWDGGSGNVWSYSNTNKCGGEAGEFKAKYVSSTGTSRLITPAINTIGINLLTLKFNHFFDDYSAGLTLKIQSSADGVTWSDEDWYVLSGGGDIGPELVETEITENLNSETTYIAFAIQGNHYKFDYWYIDNIAIDGLPTGSPFVITYDALDVSEDSATVGGSITAQGDEDVTQSGVVYSTDPNPLLDTPGAIILYSDPLVSEGDFTFILNQLNAATTFYFRAFATNSIATSYGSIREFTTLCGKITPDYTQNFNLNSIPPCWDNISNGGNSSQKWNFGSFSSGLAGSGSYAFLNSDAFGSGNSQNADLISPTISIEQYGSITISFKHYFREYSSSSAVFKYSLNGGVSWITVGTWNKTTANPVQFEHTIDDLQESDEIIFAWNYSGSWSYYWCIDDVFITGELMEGEMPVVMTLEPTEVTPTTATINGTVNPSSFETSVLFQWGIDSVTEHSVEFLEELVGSYSLPVSSQLTDLQPGTQYLCRVAAQNVFGEAFGDIITFTTLSTGVSYQKINEMFIYPVPSSNYIFIESEGRVGSTYQIYSLTGATVESGNMSGSFQRIDIVNLPNGVYIIKVMFNDGNTFFDKFVKN